MNSESPEARATREQERQLGSLLSNLWDNGEKLLRQELELGLNEIDIRVDETLVKLDQRVDDLKGELLRSAIAGGAMLGAGLFFLAGVALLLAYVMPLWAAVFVVAIATGAAGMSFARAHKNPKAQARSHAAAHPNRFLKEIFK